MKKINRIKTVAFVLLCLPFCGAWTSVSAAAEQSDRYVGGELISTYASNETISYVSKQVVEDISTANGTPKYRAIDSIQNGCGAIVGAIIVGFYDKYYENLIPNWASYYSTGTYKGQDKTYVYSLIQDLYNLMQTNIVAPGVSQDEFKNGLKSYVVNHGYNIQYTSLGAGNNFNYGTFKTAVNNNQPTVLFVQSSNIYLLDERKNEDLITSGNISGNHVMVAYGYYEVKYTLSNRTRIDKYLRVATGLSTDPTAFYKIGTYVDATYQVTIN
ncbi:MAG: hypothetical protein K2F90_05695 [Clostridiales bacterium]|nr:hypothetical protein [Clostridiales bacterium]